jgi:hypothetical protein
MLNEQGISAAVVHGDMPDDERKETLRRFNEGRYVEWANLTRDTVVHIEHRGDRPCAIITSLIKD